MKIIKDPHTAWSLRVECPRCKAVLEITSTDIYSAEIGSGMDFASHRAFLVDCAVCKRWMEVDRVLMPEWVARERRDATKPGPL